VKAAFWLAFWAVLLLLPADLAQAQMVSSGDRPLVLWSPPPVIGYFSLDSSVVDESSPLIATADWPAFTDSVIAGLQACGHFRHPLKAWALRTVAAPVFGVRTPGDAIGDQPFLGFTFPTIHEIYVVQSRVQSRRLIRHELLHAFLADNGFDPRHTTPVADALFDKCAKEVVQ
jgi:hypothetical protein